MTKRSRTVVGIVLAAGRSQRMGEPKPLLEIEGRTFLERTISTLLDGGCAPVIVVLSPSELTPGMSEIAKTAHVRVVENPKSKSEPIDSLRIALDAAPEHAVAAAVLPVDHPMVQTATVETLIGALESSGSPIVRPVFEGRPGHPILLGRSIWGELAESDLPEGTRTVVRRHADEVDDVVVDDPGVRTDIDTRDDYNRVLRK